MATIRNNLCNNNRIPLAVAKQKCDEQNSSFVRVEVIEHICVEPAFLGRFREGVEQQLEKKLMKYSEDLEGIIVTYDKLKLENNCGRVVGEQPFIHFDIRVEYIVFKPTINCLLLGVVNKIGIDHVGLLVHDSFNASISQASFTWNGPQNVEIGTEVLFRVTGVEAAGDVLLINGALDGDQSTKSSHNKAKSKKEKAANSCEESSSPKKKKKKKHKEHEANPVEKVGESLGTKHKVSSHKRTHNSTVEEIKSSDSSFEIKVKKIKTSDNEDYNNISRHTHKKKKKKKSSD